MRSITEEEAKQRLLNFKQCFNAIPNRNIVEDAFKILFPVETNKEYNISVTFNFEAVEGKREVTLCNLWKEKESDFVLRVTEFLLKHFESKR
jgi:hypothetical protein